LDASSPEQHALLDRAARHFRGVAASDAFARSNVALAFVAVERPALTEPVGWCWGFLLPRPDGSPMAYVHDLAVDEHARRRGHGRGLLMAFLAAAARAGATKAFLSTGEGNRAARALYESVGGGPPAQGPTVNYWFVLAADK
jgi:ribosomal protein S18 acetylase RimI-like enzyme